MSAYKTSEEFTKGFDEFINFGLDHANGQDSIRCPCLDCGNMINRSVKEVRGHVFFNGIDQSYRTWIFHGEEEEGNKINEDSTRKRSSLEDTNEFDDYPQEMVEDAMNDQFVDNPEKLHELLSDAEKPLYDGCLQFTKLSALVQLYNFKARNNLSDKGFSELLGLLKKNIFRR